MYGARRVTPSSPLSLSLPDFSPPTKSPLSLAQGVSEWLFTWPVWWVVAGVVGGGRCGGCVAAGTGCQKQSRPAL